MAMSSRPLALRWINRPAGAGGYVAANIGRNPDMKNSQWIIVANASLARLFRRDSPTEPLIPLATMEHARSRLKGTELAADRPGHEATDNSSGGNRFEPRSDVHRKEHQRFAHEVAQRLDAGLQAEEYGELWLLASSAFLGELRAQLSDAVSQRVKLAVDTDLTSFGLAEIEQRLHDARVQET
jgi:protein required for attachment to host cells